MKTRHLFTLAIVGLVGFANVAHAQFTDIQKDSLNYLYKHHYIDGYPDGTFGPQKQINRAEFVTLILRAEDIPLTQTQNCFPDVKAGAWYHNYVCTAKELGYIKGYEDGLFHPEQSINKVEALKVLAEIQKWRMDLSLGYTLSFKDISKDAWYYDKVRAAEYFVYIDKATNFYPANFITRGEMAEVLFRTILDKKFWMQINNVDNNDGSHNDLPTLTRDFFKIEAISSQKTYADFEAYQNKYPEKTVFIKAADGYIYAMMELRDVALESDAYVRTFPIVYAKFDQEKNKIAFDWDANYSWAASGVGVVGEFKQADQNKLTVDAFTVQGNDWKKLYQTFIYTLKPIRD